MSGFSGAALVQQTLTASGDSTVRDVTMQTEVHPALPVYFHLDIWDDDSEQQGFGFEVLPILQLEPGKKYVISVQTRHEGEPTQKYIHLQSSLSLYLRVMESAVAQAITIANPQTTLMQEEVDGYSHEFELETAAELPLGQVTLELQYLRNAKRSKPETAVTLQVPLAGNYNPVDQTLLEACHVDLAIERPAQSAIIHVENVGTVGQIRLTCWGYYANRTLQTDPFTPPNVCLADFIEENVDPLTILGRLRTFSSSHPDLELIVWINLLRQRLGDAMQLIIVDHTDTEIPWEMLELKDGMYLGATVPVARWLSVPHYEKHVRMQVKAKKRFGRVMAYLNEDELPHAAQERQQLSYFVAHFHPDTQGLRTSLNESLAQIGLVYLACHGMFVSDADEIVYGSWNNPSNRLIPLQLNLLLRYHEMVERPVLFVNACNSARVKRHGKTLHGLPIIMLERIASGYIGTLGPVGSTYASEIASNILATIRDADEGTKPVELLRLLRASAAEQFNANIESQDSQLRFIYTFMYVYYGNPLAELQLLSVPIPGDGDE